MFSVLCCCLLLPDNKALFVTMVGKVGEGEECAICLGGKGWKHVSGGYAAAASTW